ncbi:hypothetical protein DMN91_004208 [Ooceraea biroi]|uniref:L27 domain-containing protein n=1 Tax=Ooceraea biroi TaxID=2015173 RepID=A0A3L8DU61_OOCBI|nr:hypothetical protein DMN91_004208 [Ooceraea biroi]
MNHKVGINGHTWHSFVVVCEEAHRALELLEDYHAKLTRPQDKQLRLAIERVIRIFKSRLFQALLEVRRSRKVFWRSLERERVTAGEVHSMRTQD